MDAMMPHTTLSTHESAHPAGLVRTYVWEAPVRISHWLIVLSVTALSFTGYYMHNPFLVATGRHPFVMGTMRFIHLCAAFLFILSYLLRIYWFHVGNQWADWHAFVPLSREKWRGMGRMVKYYSFFQKNLDHYVGHNALAGVIYTFMFFLMFLEILTGLALYNAIVKFKLLGVLVGWLPWFLDIQYLRMFHFGMIFVFFIFVTHHVYSALLVSSVEHNGLIESIFTGYKFVPREELEASVGVKPPK
jgi:Ni/Fe-hydrogenase 1 B-type cytochrome subunit